MKTNVTMHRKMGGLDIKQQTKDGMFEATDLLRQVNKGERGKSVEEFLRNKKTIEFIKAIEESENLETRKVVCIIRGKNARTLMHPYLFIDFAMWINPKFKVSVIRFVYDQLIQKRQNAGDNYKSLMKSGVKLDGFVFSEVATAMNYIVFGNKGENLRQTATIKQLEELDGIQIKLSFSIDKGYINSYEQLLKELRTMYREKYYKNVAYA